MPVQLTFTFGAATCTRNAGITQKSRSLTILSRLPVTPGVYRGSELWREPHLVTKRSFSMKQFRSVLLAGLLIALPIVSFAATRRSISIAEPVAVGSTVLQPGDYKIQWDG